MTSWLGCEDELGLEALIGDDMGGSRSHSSRGHGATKTRTGVKHRNPGPTRMPTRMHGDPHADPHADPHTGAASGDIEDGLLSWSADAFD